MRTLVAICLFVSLVSVSLFGATSELSVGTRVVDVNLLSLQNSTFIGTVPYLRGTIRDEGIDYSYTISAQLQLFAVDLLSRYYGPVVGFFPLLTTASSEFFGVEQPIEFGSTRLDTRFDFRAELFENGFIGLWPALYADDSQAYLDLYFGLGADGLSTSDQGTYPERIQGITWFSSINPFVTVPYTFSSYSTRLDLHQRVDWGFSLGEDTYGMLTSDADLSVLSVTDGAFSFSPNLDITSEVQAHHLLAEEYYLTFRGNLLVHTIFSSPYVEYEVEGQFHYLVDNLNLYGGIGIGASGGSLLSSVDILLGGWYSIL